MEEQKTMRLNQVARLLNVGIPTIVSHLTAKGFKVDNNPNVKLNAKQLDFLAKDFKTNVFSEGYSNNDSTTSGLKAIGRKIDFQTELQIRIDLVKEKKLTGLDLSGLGLEKIPKEIADLTMLQELNLQDNEITKIENLDRLVNLQVLNLSINRISEIEGLNNLVNLRHLGLAYNNRYTTTTGSISGGILQISNLNNLQNLEFLDLSFNLIGEINGLDNLLMLSSLNLSNNSITKIENIGHLSNLKILHLSNNSITKIENIGHLSNLKILHLSNNSITKIENIGHLSNLESLYLSNNSITKIENIGHLSNLERLYLSNNRIDTPKGLRSLKELSHLVISQNPLEQKYGIELVDGNNHWPLIKNILDRLTEVREAKNKGNSDVYNFYLPAKIVLLGNHAAGKSSLLYYLQYSNLDYTGDSTHLLRIVDYETENELKPLLAKFFDFGGQDLLPWHLSCIFEFGRRLFVGLGQRQQYQHNKAR
jgi:internalin A